MADKEWTDIKERTGAAHGQLVADIQEQVMQLTSYLRPLIGR